MLCVSVLYTVSLIQMRISPVIVTPSELSAPFSHFTFIFLVITFDNYQISLPIIPIEIDRFINSNRGSLEIFAWDSLNEWLIPDPVSNRRRRPLLCNREIWLTIPAYTLQIQNGRRRGLNLAMHRRGRGSPVFTDNRISETRDARASERRRRFSGNLSMRHIRYQPIFPCIRYQFVQNQFDCTLTRGKWNILSIAFFHPRSGRPRDENIF